MSDAVELTSEEREVLLEALSEPIAVGDPERHLLYLKLCGRGFLQRAGAVSLANGWRGSPHAFVLTREGWSLLKLERGRAPISRVG